MPASAEGNLQLLSLPGLPYRVLIFDGLSEGKTSRQDIVEATSLFPVPVCLKTCSTPSTTYTI